MAHHFVEAASADDRLREKALDYSMRAGRDAFAELAYEESARHFDVALTFADSLEPRGEAELLLNVARSRYMAGDPGGAISAAWKRRGSERSSMTVSFSPAPPWSRPRSADRD